MIEIKKTLELVPGDTIIEDDGYAYEVISTIRGRKRSQLNLVDQLTSFSIAAINTKEWRVAK